MGSIDEISSMLGRLCADNEEANRQRTAMWTKLDEMSIELTELCGTLKTLNGSHIALHGVVHNEHGPVISDVKALKQRGIGMLAGVGLFGAGGYAAISEIIKRMTGHQ